MGTTADEERERVIATILKIRASKAPGDKVWTAEEVDEIFSSYDAAVEADFVAAEKQEVAGTDQIKAFADAATAIDPLSETMRLRVLRALDALMLPPPTRKPLLPPELLAKLIDTVLPQLIDAFSVSRIAAAAPQPPPGFSKPELDALFGKGPPARDVPLGYTKIGTVARAPSGGVLLFGAEPEDVFTVPEDLVRQVLAAFEKQHRRDAGEPIVTPPPKPDDEI
jgi:hypothetical protein